MSDPIRVECPCCGAKLALDPASGEVFSFEEPTREPKSFEQAMGDVQQGRQRREDAFTKAFDRTRRIEDVLDQKFQEAKKKAATDPSSRPRNPFDGE